MVPEHNNGEWSFHAHLITGSNNDTDCGDHLLQGERIGNVGNSGLSSGPQLQFQLVDRQNPDHGGAVALPM